MNEGQSRQRRFSVDNLGCAKNQVDAESIIAALEASGWRYEHDSARAELIIVNSCGFIEPAKEQSIQAVLQARAQFPEAKILLAGCLAQRYGTELARELAEADGIFGNRAPERIVEVAGRVMEGERVLLIPDSGRNGAERGVALGEGGGIARVASQSSRRRLLSPPGSVYVKIAEGCRNRCTYCAIPLIRGDLASRPAREVVEEIGRFAREGLQEIILVAQDSASYGRDRNEGGLLGLLERIGTLPGDFWIRLLYFHPDRFDARILPLFRGDPRFLPYFDLPFQHAALSVLRRMGRSGDVSRYLDLIREIRSALPAAVIRSTFLLGFPGEGAAEFDELLEFQRAADLDWVGVFPYSREEGTAAYRMRVPEEKRARRAEAIKRARLIEEQQLPITERRLERFVRKRMEVLIEERIEGSDLFLGRGYPHAPEVDGCVVVDGALRALEIGSRIECLVTGRNGIDLAATASGVKPRPGSS